jgi:hypothetical protein
MLLVSCCLKRVKFEDEEAFVEFDGSRRMKPLSRTPSLYICTHLPSTSEVPFGQKHVALFSREILPFVHGMQSPVPVVR